MYNVTMIGTISQIDEQLLNAALKTYIEKEAKIAARKFAEAALRKIPIRTGFVAGAFGTLVDLVGAEARLNPIIEFTRKEYYYGSGGRVLKSPNAGRQFATPSKDIFKWEDNLYVFNYAVDITYFAINDQVGGHAPTAPWEAFEAGRLAYEEHMSKLQYFPKPEDYLKELKIG